MRNTFGLKIPALALVVIGWQLRVGCEEGSIISCIALSGRAVDGTCDKSPLLAFWSCDACVVEGE